MVTRGSLVSKWAPKVLLQVKICPFSHDIGLKGSWRLDYFGLLSLRNLGSCWSFGWGSEWKLFSGSVQRRSWNRWFERVCPSPSLAFLEYSWWPCVEHLPAGPLLVHLISVVRSGNSTSTFKKIFQSVYQHILKCCIRFVRTKSAVPHMIDQI